MVTTPEPGVKMAEHVTMLDDNYDFPFLKVGLPATMVITLVLMGKPRDQVLDDVAGAAGLVAAGWTFVCAGAA